MRAYSLLENLSSVYLDISPFCVVVLNTSLPTIWERPCIVILEERFGKARSSMELRTYIMEMNPDFYRALFVSERDDGVELGGLLGREYPEKDADRNGHSKAQNDRPTCHRGGKRRSGFDQ